MRINMQGPAILALAAAYLCAPVLAFAAQPGQVGHSETMLLVQLVVLLAAGRLLGEVMERLGQPAVMGQLLAGVMLGPTLLGAVWPEGQQILFPPAVEQKAMLDGIAQLGVLLLLLLTGMETDLKLVRKIGRAALAIAITGLSVPFVCGFLLGEALPDDVLLRPELRLVTSLFLGTALSISSVKIVAMVVREMDFMRRNVGQIIIASAIIEDTIGWIIIALTFGIALHGAVDAMALGKSVLGTAVFLVASFTIGRRLVARLIRWANDNLISEVPVITVILIVMGVMALLTDAIGIHTVLGAFVAGMLIGQSPILTGEIDRQLRGLITGLFMPVFFAAAGLRADLTVLAAPRLFALTLGLIVIASLGKFAGAFLGGRFGGLTFREAFAVGCGMNARGSTEVIVASIGLSMGALSQDLFTMIVAMAVLTTLAMPPMLRWALLRIPIGKEEQARLDREAREATGFVTQFERLLVVVDSSINARFAAHLAGLIAGPRQILTTVLQIGQADRSAASEETQPSAEAVVKVSAQAAQAARPYQDEQLHAVEVTARQADASRQSLSAAVETELRKGYDLLMIGIEPTIDAGIMSQKVSEIARGSKGPLAIIDARGIHRTAPRMAGFSILLPLRATLHSGRAAELAIELARASRSPIEALYVSDKPRRRWPDPVSLATGLEEEAALKDFVTLAELEGVKVRTSIHRSGDPGNTIVRFARRSRHDLIVLGVSRRAGDRLSFGQVAADVISAAPCSIMLVSS